MTTNRKNITRTPTNIQSNFRAADRFRTNLILGSVSTKRTEQCSHVERHWKTEAPSIKEEVKPNMTHIRPATVTFEGDSHANPQLRESSPL